MTRESQEERVDRLVRRLLGVTMAGAAMFGMLLVFAVAAAGVSRGRIIVASPPRRRAR